MLALRSSVFQTLKSSGAHSAYRRAVPPRTSRAQVHSGSARSEGMRSGGPGGGGTGGSGGGSGSNGGGGGGFFGGLGGLWAAYMRSMETAPWATKIATSAMLNGIGDCLGQTLFEEGKPFDWQRFAKFTFLGGALVAPVLGVWYSKLNAMIPGKGTKGALGRLALDQGIFAPFFVTLFISSLLTLNGEARLIKPKLQQDLLSTVTANWALWIPGQFLNFRFVPAQFNLLASNVLALIWSTYLSWASTRKVKNASGAV